MRAGEHTVQTQSCNLNKYNKKDTQSVAEQLAVPVNFSMTLSASLLILEIGFAKACRVSDLSYA